MSDIKNARPEDTFEPGQTLEIPAQFLKALSLDSMANDAFDRLMPLEQREFIDWVADAKSAEDRMERSTTALQKLKDGRRPED